MSEIRERVKSYIEVFRTGKAVKIITDLLAELKRVETEQADLMHIAYLQGMDKRKQLIDELEAENERMKADMSGSFFVEQIKQKAAMECVEIFEGYPTSVLVHATSRDAKIATETKQTLIGVIKSHFNLED